MLLALIIHRGIAMREEESSQEERFRARAACSAIEWVTQNVALPSLQTLITSIWEGSQ